MPCRLRALTRSSWKGFSEVEVPRQKGETYTSYKVYYCAGKEVRREKLADSKYRAQRGRKVVGTK